MPKLRVEMEIDKVVMELPDTKTIRLMWPEGYDVDFKTGQFITLYWPHKQKYKRAYSLSSSGLDRGYYEVTVKRDGKMGTSIVDWAEEGDSMWVIEPTGSFLPVFEPAGKHLICLAGGSGGTPFRAFAREAAAKQLDTDLTILYSVRTTDDIIFNEEFRELEKANPRFKFHVTCTRLAEDDPWGGRRGRIDADWVREQIGSLEDTIFYACGPNALIEFSERLVLDEIGVDKKQMIVEKWG